MVAALVALHGAFYLPQVSLSYNEFIYNDKQLFA